MIRINDLRLELRDALNLEQEVANLKKLVLSLYPIQEKDIISFNLHKKAVDARKKVHVFFVYSIDIALVNEKDLIQKNFKNIQLAPNMGYVEAKSGSHQLEHPPVIIATIGFKDICRHLSPSKFLASEVTTMPTDYTVCIGDGANGDWLYQPHL